MNQVTLSMDEIVGQIQAMRKQEDTSYCYRRYLPGGGHNHNESLLNLSWREKICQWSYNVVDHFDLSREVVAVSLDLFDRYLATRGNECSGNLALLASLTTLYIAMKLYDPKKIQLDTLANLSRGQFSAREVTSMEWTILAALEWHLHPPTASTFVSSLVLFLPEEASPCTRKELVELSRYLTELAVCDSYFVDQNNSIVAFAAILNVMEDLPYSQLSAGTRERFLRDLLEEVGLSYSDPRVVTARGRIRAMFTATATPPSCPEQGQPTVTCTTSTTSSPTTTKNPVTPVPQEKTFIITTATDASSLSSMESPTISTLTGKPIRHHHRRHRRIHSGCSVDSSSCARRYSPSPHRHHCTTVIAVAHDNIRL